jgi:mRNA interferase MazF
MDPPSVGDVVIIPFPYSDLTQSKRRPALVLAEVGRGGFLLCQITSKQSSVPWSGVTQEEQPRLSRG